MKKKKILITIAITLVLVIIALLVIFRERLFTQPLSLKNDPEIEKLVSIQQAELSAFVFATQESPQDHRLHINLTPFLTLSVEEKKISKFYIENFKSTGKLGEALLIYPTSLSTDTVGRTFLFTESSELIMSENISSEGNSIEYSIVPNVTKYNEVMNEGILSPYFGIIIKNIGTVNYSEIMERDNIFEGSKYLEYSGIDISKLDTTLQFDVRIIFDDGSKYTKRFKGQLKGESLEKEISPLITLEIAE